MQTETSATFLQLMQNRLIVGARRYGLMRSEGKQNWDRVSSAKKRLDLYIETGNTEHLVDVANMCLLEFEEGTHPNKHFAASDDGIHTEAK